MTPTAPSTRVFDAGTVYAPAPPPQDLLADGLQATITGRPLPEALRPASVAPTAPASVEEGITRILAGPPDRAAGA